ncbi:MAG: O-methyltransferase [Ignavibacteria bacterium]|jgi:predicted O-methyltransferase YrrM
MKGVPLNEDLYQYILDTFVEEDDILKSVVRKTEEKDFPLIQISPELGKFLQMLVIMIRAEKILEIGTLAGYSAIWMARALPKNGKLITLERDQEHAIASRENFKRAGLEAKIEIITGDAVKSLDKLSDEKFDLAFIDADKTKYPVYFDKVIKMMNHGGIITADNTLKKGEIISQTPDDEVLGTRKLNEKMSKDPRITSLLIPISDGLTLGVVK